MFHIFQNVVVCFLHSKYTYIYRSVTRLQSRYTYRHFVQTYILQHMHGSCITHAWFILHANMQFMCHAEVTHLYSPASIHICFTRTDVHRSCVMCVVTYIYSTSQTHTSYTWFMVHVSCIFTYHNVILVHGKVKPSCLNTLIIAKTTTRG